jgi:competence protein ComEC
MAALTPPSLYTSRRDIVFVAVLVAVLVSLHTLWRYVQYRDFISKPFYVTDAKVLDAYIKTKRNYRYQVVRAKSEEGWEFYTTMPARRLYRHHRLRLRLIPDEGIGFVDFLGRFYVKSRLIRAEPETKGVRNALLENIAAQHDDNETTRFYQAIFLAEPLPKAMRERIAAWGVSHLVALSGFHLGILAGVLYMLLRPLYRAWQRRFAPYRSEWVDTGATVMLLLGAYVWLAGAPDSLVRAYAMTLIGWATLITGVSLKDAGLLFSVAGALIVSEPSFLVSLGFWLSVAGVFYILLLLRYGKKLSPLVQGAVLIPVGVYVLMLPVVHFFFETVSPLQLLSPLLSLLFTLFFPLTLLLHLVGYGDGLDSIVRTFFKTDVSTYEVGTPLWFFAFYLVLSFAAMRYKAAFYALIASAAAFVPILYL